MPVHSQLNDAAVAVGKAMDELNIDFGIFGGYAVAALGGVRESKDIDCVVNCNKELLVQQLSRMADFRSMGNIRPDVAQFLYGSNNVLIEFFPISMAKVQSDRILISSGSTTAYIKVLNVVFIFKGKLQAAATRSKHSDAADLLWLEGRYNAELKARNAEFDKAIIGKTLVRYPHLEYAFIRLDLDVEACKELADGYDPHAPPAQAQLDGVQSGLLYGL